jgi:putative lipoprotein
MLARIVAPLVTAGVLSWSAPALCDAPSPDPDPWFGRDKALHFSGSFALATGSYALGVGTLDRRWIGLIFGLSFPLALGATKEGLDAAGLGTPSWKDFAWDCIGTVLGVGVSITFDAALRGPRR